MSRDLQNTIKLREWVRMALAGRDMEAVARLNQQADAAYKKLSKAEQKAYREWAFGLNQAADIEEA